MAVWCVQRLLPCSGGAACVHACVWTQHSVHCVRSHAQGGFSGWVKDGLAVETSKVDYEAGQIDVLNDNLEVIAARVGVYVLS